MTPGSSNDRARPDPPGRLRPIDPALARRIAELVDGVEVDLDAPLAPRT